MLKILAALASLLIPGMGHLIQGKIIIGCVWFLVWLCVCGLPVINILAAIHCLVEK